MSRETVETAGQVGDKTVITKGLKVGETVVTSANFLIDSESQLQAAAGSFVPPPPGAGACRQREPERRRGSINFSRSPILRTKATTSSR